MTEDLVGQLGYLGIVLLLVLGGLGLPVPEEAPVIGAAVLSKNGAMWWPLALASCYVGVLLGDFIVYFLGYYYGERVLSFPLTRKFLTRAREAQIKGYFHRHGFKILILGRFAVGFRTAAYLTAGILRLPALKLFLTDLLAASLSTLLMFGLGWRFAEWIETGLREVKHWIFVISALSLLAFLLYRYYRGRRRAGLPVGPPVLVANDVPLPPDDLHPISSVAPVAPAGLPPKPVLAPAEPPPSVPESTAVQNKNGQADDAPAHEPSAPMTSEPLPRE
ncbi:MAG TPA: VTT domain-containing protein [Isosphaeraceae bacterium]|jgi:membrane protein DedA with SNARE-associated domain|nr:VTT domain-containing protein [Isosphaeraceae bacterium]